MSQIPRNSPPRSKDAQDPAAEERTSVVPIRAGDTLENTMPPTPLRELLAADGASVYVLTQETALFDTVKQAGGEQYPVFSVDSWTALKAAITEGRCGIALLDIDSLAGSLSDRVTELARLNPSIVILLASSRDRADALLDLLSQRKIHRLLIKPPTVGITRLMVESSVNRYIELRRRPELRAGSGTPETGTARSWRNGALAGGLVLGLLAVVVLTILYVRQPTNEPVVVTMPTARPAERVAAPSATPGTVQTQTSQGTDLRVPSFIEDAALVDAPLTSTPVAVAGPFPLEDVEDGPAGPTTAELEARYAEIEAALVADDLDSAGALLAELESVDAGSSRLTFLNAQLERARATAALAEETAALAAAAAANPSELTSLISLSRTRLNRGQIDGPAGDSAMTYLNRARALDATAAEVATLSADIGAAAATAAEAEIAAGQLDAAEAHVLLAQRLGVAASTVGAVELSLSVARDAQVRADQVALLDTADDRRQEGALFAPDGDSALDALLDARALDATHPDVAAAAAALETDILAFADEALGRSDWASAEAAIAALMTLGAAESSIDSVRGDLLFGRTQEAYLAQASPATELDVLEFAPPVYPDRALTRGTQGWVDLEFVVDRDGRPRDLTVTAAEPPAEFDAAALAAVGDYVFVPFERDGRVYERRVSLRLRFAFQ